MAGFWALYNAESYEQGIIDIIHQGGDADSNASVAGAMLGARFGFSQLPEHLVENLKNRDKLQDHIQKLLDIIES